MLGWNVAVSELIDLYYVFTYEYTPVDDLNKKQVLNG